MAAVRQAGFPPATQKEEEDPTRLESKNVASEILKTESGLKIVWLKK
jgi:hypothetical protein